MSLEYKSVPFAIKAVSDGETGWEIAGLASTWWGEPDYYGDVVQPGAFADSLAVRSPKFLYEHVEPIGKTIEIRETDDGLYGRWSIVDTQAGTDAHKLAKAGVLDSLSIGFFPVEWETRSDGVRVLQKIDLFEVSAVAIPANRNALITDVRSRPFEHHVADVQVAVREWVERCRAGLAQRQKDGRDLSAARRDQMAAMSGSLRAAADEVDALLSPPAPEVINVGAELRKRRLYRAGVLERPA